MAKRQKTDAKELVDSLHKACRDRFVQDVKEVLDRGADPNAVNDDGETALLVLLHNEECSTSFRHTDTLRLLLDRGANVEAVDKHGWTALERAIQDNLTEVVGLLRRHGARPTTRFGGSSVSLHTALMDVGCGGVGAMRKILRKRADEINMVDWRGRTLIDTVLGRNMTLFKVLVEHGAKCNDEALLFDAIGRGDLVFVEEILGRGVEVDKMGPCGQTALMEACKYGHVAIVEKLLDHGANVEAVDKHGWTALMRACYGDCVDVVEKLLDRGAEVDKADTNGETALLRTCRWGRPEVVQTLVERGASMDKCNWRGRTAFEIAKAYKNTVVVKLLRNLGAKTE